MLLEARCSLRFTKLEKRSPAMAKVATRVPIPHPRPINSAQMEVAKTDSTMPRMVFEGPNMGWPSTKRAPPSSGRAKATPRSFLAATAVPLATTSRISNCSSKEPCITRPRAPYLIEHLIGRDLPRLRRLLVGQCQLGGAKANICPEQLQRPLLTQRGHETDEANTPKVFCARQRRCEFACGLVGLAPVSSLASPAVFPPTLPFAC